MFCKYCGHELSDDANFCPFCGQNLTEEINLNNNFNNSNFNNNDNGNFRRFNQRSMNDQDYSSLSYNSNDTGSIGYGILGFIIPIVGLILFLTWKNEQPKNAKIAGKGALISIIISIIFYIIVLSLYGNYAI